MTSIAKPSVLMPSVPVISESQRPPSAETKKAAGALDEFAAARLAKFSVGDEPINILIVDDEPANLVVLETVLDDPRYRLVRALSADQALLALVESEFALLILDVRLPGMSGFELAQIIKERKKNRRCADHISDRLFR